MRIIFMGTPAFAVPSLDALIQSDHEVVAVVTSTDKYGGRGGKQLIESAVKKHAVTHGIPVLQPPNLKRPSFLEELASYSADLQVIVAFRMLPVVVWDMPPLGSINLHGSLLPAYRGAAPIHWAVINGEPRTGVTTFQLQHAIDTGTIYHQASLDIGPDETTGDLHDRMMIVGADLLTDTVEAIAAGTAVARPQDEDMVSHAPKLYREDCKVDFNRPRQEVHNLIRGLSPFPGAYALLDDQPIKLLRSTIPVSLSPMENLEPGKLILTDEQALLVQCQDGIIQLLEVKPSGKRAMSAQDFINGNEVDGAYLR